MAAALLALVGACSWGVGDFCGGLASRRAPTLTVLALSQAVGLVGVVAWVAFDGGARPSVTDLAPSVLAGVGGMVGLAALYRGMAIGAMGIVAPISAASPIVPLTVDAVRGIVPSAPQLLGIALVLGGIAVLSHEPGGGGRSPRAAAGAGLAVVAALGFGVFVVGLDAAADESVAWAVLAARATSAGLALLVAMVLTAPLVPPRPLWAPIVAVGVFDTLANVLVAAATTRGAVGVVGVLASLYPLTTILLARLVLGERIDGARRVGAVAALAGAALVAAG